MIHVPVGGTAALVASAKVTAEAKLPDETAGPHGGTIQIVGDDRLEMVAEADTGRTRVFVLDVNLQPVTIETRTLRMGFVAERSELVTFVPAPSGLCSWAGSARRSILCRSGAKGGSNGGGAKGGGNGGTH